MGWPVWGEEQVSSQEARMTGTQGQDIMKPVKPRGHRREAHVGFKGQWG
jgi:hypothetical protein